VQAAAVAYLATLGELRETHRSFVSLAPEVVYKLKKRVRDDGADYSRLVWRLLSRLFNGRPNPYRDKLLREIDLTCGFSLLRGFDRGEIQRSAIRPYAGELDERVLRHKVLAGHGDLRPEHACLAEPRAILDCIEFDRELRVFWM
jgi:aminoglycoside phosphotransferase family enzyme